MGFADVSLVIGNERPALVVSVSPFCVLLGFFNAFFRSASRCFRLSSICRKRQKIKVANERQVRVGFSLQVVEFVMMYLTKEKIALLRGYVKEKSRGDYFQ